MTLWLGGLVMLLLYLVGRRIGQWMQDYYDVSDDLD